MKNNKIKKAIAFAITISFLAVTFDFGVNNPKARAAADSALYFYPEETSTIIGSNLNIPVMIDPGTNAVTGVRINITYDQTKLSLTGISCSSTFSQRLYPREDQSIVPSPEDGTARIDCTISPADASITDVSEVATFSFLAIGVDSDLLVDITDDSLAVADEEEENVITDKTGALVTVTSDSTSPTVTAFVIPSKSDSRTINITTFTATDDVSVIGYKVTESATAPSADDSDWLSSAPTGYVFATHGSKTLYAWAKDLSGNVSSSLGASISVEKKSEKKKEKKKKSTPKYYISNSKSKVARGAIMTQRGKKFSKNSLVLLYFSRYGGGYYAPTRIMTGSTGAFSLSYRITKPKGKYSWYAIDVKTGKKSKIKYYTVK